MKRLYIGIALLLMVLVIGIGLTVSFRMLHEPLAQKLNEAKAAALAEDWDAAAKLTEEARSDWERIRHFTAAVADHEPLEEMDALFARLQVLGRLQESADFAADCAELARLATAMADSQAFTWWNLL